MIQKTYKITIIMGENSLYYNNTITTLLTIENRNATLKIDTNSPIKIKTKLNIKTNITENNTPVTNGTVIYKINGKTIKDAEGNPIKTIVNNGQTTLNYTLPESIKAGNYTLDVVFSNPYYNTITDTKQVEVIK